MVFNRRSATNRFSPVNRGLKPTATVIESLRGIGWQDGYAAFTVSKSLVPEAENYIAGQREHHRIKTFEEEYRAFLVKQEISFDEKYVFDGEFAG